MDLLIVDAVEDEVLRWLEARHGVRHAPELAREPRALRQSLFNVRGLVLPAAVRVDEEMLSFAPMLRVVARVAPGLENIDVEACTRAGVELVRGAAATAPAEAEFMIGALIALLRPGADGGRVTPGRELASATVGLIGMAPAARFVSAMLSGFGSRLVGYDPTLHASDLLWGRWRIEPMGLRELLQTADAVCVQLPFFSRYQGLLGERYLPQCKPGQVLVSTSHSAVFDAEVLAGALRSGRMGGAWLDSVEPGLLEPGRPLHGVANLRVSSRLAGYTQESRVRAVWAVAHRLDEVLSQAPRVAREFRPSAAAPLTGPVSMPGPLGGPVSGPVPLDEAEPFSPAADAATGPAPASS
ncbi:MAG TPA: NAD(P)-dependent oxidoreductase [Methylibium sp.]|nr:NAD(P)-dependent oxidoreductase [Methylibium sp.]